MKPRKPLPARKKPITRSKKPIKRYATLKAKKRLKRSSIKRRKPFSERYVGERDNPFSRYWQELAYDQVMKMNQNKPCVICGGLGDKYFMSGDRAIYTVGHHILKRSTHPSYRCHPMNIVPLCVRHHCTDSDAVSPHSDNPDMVEVFNRTLTRKCSKQALWAWSRKHNEGYHKRDWKKIYQKLLEKEAIDEKGM